MSRHLENVTVKNNKVTFKFVERDYWGTIRRRWQVTVRKSEVITALSQADIVVPWSQVKQ